MSGRTKVVKGADQSRLFSEEEVERGRRYARPLYVARLARAALGLGVLAALAFTPAGDALARPGGSLPWWLETPLFAAVCLLAVAVATLPLSCWTGLVRERRFGLSTQTLGGWASDRVRGLAVGAVLTGAALAGLGALVRLAPEWWPLLSAAAAAAVVLVLGFLGPLVLEPLFNRFEPLPDDALARRVRALAERAGVPVRDVLVADASRRTRKLNAYVSGYGATRRVVVFDTLLARAPTGEVEAVVAHELAHRRGRHVELLVSLAASAAALGVLVLWLVLGDGAGDSRNVPHVLLLFGLLELGGAPLLAAVSRRLERTADRVALEVTRDPESFEAMFRTLAAANLADLAPPRLLHLLLASHPTIPERIRAARATAASATVAA